MGLFPSHLNTSSLKVINKYPEAASGPAETVTAAGHGARDPGGLHRDLTSPKLLVSIVDKTTVIIAEGKSVATQTEDCTWEVGVDDKPCKEPMALNKVAGDSDEDVKSTEHDTDDDKKSEINEQNQSIVTSIGTKIAWDEDIKHFSEDSAREHEFSDADCEFTSSMTTTLIQTKSVSPRTEVVFDDLRLNKYGKYKVRLQSDTQKCILSCAMFMETGDTVAIDRSNQKVKYVDSKFQFISSHELPDKPWAVCTRGNDVYVTMGNTQIQHLSTVDMIVEPVEVFEIPGRCLGVCVYGDYLAVGLQTGEISLLNFRAEPQKTIQLPETQAGRPCNPWHLCASKQDNILVTDSDTGVVLCVNQTAEVLFTFRGMTSPRATAVDYHGNILVVGRDMSSGAVVMVLHKDMELLHMLHVEAGPSVRTLLTWEELEFVPYCVSYRHDDVVVLGGIQDCLKIMKLGSSVDPSTSL